MRTVNFIFISLTGNTLYFLNKLKKNIEDNFNYSIEMINIKDLVKNEEPFFKLDSNNNNYFVFVPTYLEGGNGIDNGDKEILTTPLREFLRYKDNYKHCKSIVGSGNKNFNKQYCLTAKQYSEEFKIPMIDDYELKGTIEDISRITNKIIKLMED